MFNFRSEYERMLDLNKKYNIIIKFSIMSKLMWDCEIIRCIFLSFLKFDLSVISDMNLSVACFF